MSAESEVSRWDNAPGVAVIAINTTSDVDLTDPAGQTGGKIARQLFVAVGGVVAFDSLLPLGSLNGTVVTTVLTVPSNFYLNAFVSKIYSNTNATGVFAFI